MNNKFNVKTNTFFINNLLLWHTRFNTRTMPWKNEKNPYKVWLSEIILQQTKVEQGLSYYLKFVKQFPKIDNLANASEDEVLKLWQGLGYYSRARNLHYTAKYISTELKGIFPNTYTEILKLKGVGEYTAAAISSFCFNEKKAVVDGNVKRVLSRYFFIEEAIDSTKGKKIFMDLAQQLIPNKNPGEYNQAIMDFGATVCKPKNPLCGNCMLKENCMAFNKNRVSQLPFKSKKIATKNRYFYSFFIETPKGYIIEQREENDIWKKLYQFPLVEFEKKKKLSNKEINKILAVKFDINNEEIIEISKEFTQKLTHQLIHIQFISIKTTATTLLNKEKYRYTRNLTNFAFPKIFILYLQSKSLILE